MNAEEFLRLCLHGTPREMKAAIEGGADAAMKDKEGYMAIDLAIKNPALEFLEVLQRLREAAR